MDKILNPKSEYFYFWTENSPFSNWYGISYKLKNYTFHCSEQGVMWEKAQLFKDDDIAKKILDCKTAKEAKKLGRQVKNFNQKIWDENKVKIYTEHCKAKFTQNSDLKKMLIDTKGKQLVEASPTDRIWGIGYTEADAIRTNKNKWGENLLGILLTKIRDEL